MKNRHGRVTSLELRAVRELARSRRGLAFDGDVNEFG